MPKLILVKNSDTTQGRLFKVAKSQSHIDDNADWNQSDYDIVEVSQADFDSVRLYKKTVIYNGTNVTYEDIAYDIADQNHTDIKNHNIDLLEKWLADNSSKPFASNVTSYKNYLSSLDVSSIPVRDCFEEWVDSQGQEVVSPLELL